MHIEREVASERARAEKNFSPPAAHRVMNDEQLDEPFDVSGAL
jgi:hypothetical protein